MCPRFVVGVSPGRALPGHPLTAHHSYAFLKSLVGEGCGASTNQNQQKMRFRLSAFFVTARSRKAESWNGSRNGKRNLRWSKFRFLFIWGLWKWPSRISICISTTISGLIFSGTGYGGRRRSNQESKSKTFNARKQSHFRIFRSSLVQSNSKKKRAKRKNKPFV